MYVTITMSKQCLNCSTDFPVPTQPLEIPAREQRRLKTCTESLHASYHTAIEVLTANNQGPGPQPHQWPCMTRNSIQDTQTFCELHAELAISPCSNPAIAHATEANLLSTSIGVRGYSLDEWPIIIDPYNIAAQQDQLLTTIDDGSWVDVYLHVTYERPKDDVRPPKLDEEPFESQFNSGLHSAMSVTTDDSSSDLPPLLAEYFDRKGDVGIHYERLQEHDFYHQEALTERTRVRKRGCFVDVPDHQFDQSYQDRRNLIIRDLRVAEADVDALALRCREAGIDIDTDGYTDASSDSLSLISASEAMSATSVSASDTTCTTVFSK